LSRWTYALDGALDGGEHTADEREILRVGVGGGAHFAENLPGRLLLLIRERIGHVGINGGAKQTQSCTQAIA